MSTASFLQSCLFLSLIGLVSSCAPVISPELRAKVDPSLTFGEVVQDPNAYKGKMILFGGEILQTLPQKDGTTLMEVLQWPLDGRGEPQRSLTFQGRFLVLVKGNLDLSTYEKGKKVTVAGEIQGEMKGKEIGQLTARDYNYPLVLSKEIHVWRDYFYPFSGPPPRDPWFYDLTERQLRF
jgi:outer membrane lipoprotein